MPQNISAGGSPARSAERRARPPGRPRSSAPAPPRAVRRSLLRISHGSRSAASSVPGVVPVRSTHGRVRTRWVGWGPPRSRSVSADGQRQPTAGRVAHQHHASGLVGQLATQVDERRVRVLPGVLGRERVVRQHHPDAERRASRAAYRRGRVDPADEAAAVQVEHRAHRLGAAGRDPHARRPAPGRRSTGRTVRRTPWRRGAAAQARSRPLPGQHVAPHLLGPSTSLRRAGITQGSRWVGSWGARGRRHGPGGVTGGSGGVGVGMRTTGERPGTGVLRVRISRRPSNLIRLAPAKEVESDVRVRALPARASRSPPRGHDGRSALARLGRRLRPPTRAATGRRRARSSSRHPRLVGDAEEADAAVRAARPATPVGPGRTATPASSPTSWC